MTLQGSRQLRARLDAIGDTSKLLLPVARSGVREAKKLVPVRTRNLSRTIHIGQISTDSVEVVASAKYARPVEFGSRAHLIRPRNRKALRFKVGGKTVFTRLVHHPGNKAHPFLIPGVRKAISAAGGLRDRIIANWNAAA
jgi:hypothetical protein